MRRAYLLLPTAAVVLTACGGAPSPSRSPSPGATPLIADTAIDVATCHQFAAEQAGQMTARQFNVWLLQHGGQPTIGPESATGLDNTLGTTLGDWYVVQAAAPSGDLQPASYYATEVGADCRSIGA